jgi:hypothetical protein
LSFEELPKPMVLNVTNIKAMGDITGSRKSEDWTGHKVVLYVKDDVEYGGKVTGGIRVRKPRTAPAAAPAPARPAPRAAADDEFADDIPF